MFISYAREDADVRDLLKARLAEAGVDVFTDISLSPGLQAGQPKLNGVWKQQMPSSSS